MMCSAESVESLVEDDASLLRIERSIGRIGGIVRIIRPPNGGH
jgi:hypothetical protein